MSLQYSKGCKLFGYGGNLSKGQGDRMVKSPKKVSKGEQIAKGHIKFQELREDHEFVKFKFYYMFSKFDVKTKALINHRMHY